MIKSDVRQRKALSPPSRKEGTKQTEHKQNLVRLGETGHLRSTFYMNIVDEFYNPDDVGVLNYYAMRDQDSQVKASLTLLVVATLSKGWNIVATDEGQEEMVKFFEWNFDYKIDDFDGMLEELLSCIWAGYSVTEKVFGFDKDNMKYYLKRLKTLDPRYITFKTDKKGNILKNGIVQRISEENVMPTDRFIIWTHGREFGNPYGKSDLRCCHRDWFIKDVLLKMRNIFLEQHGAPTYIGKVQGENEIDDMLDMLDRLTTAANAAVKEGRSIEVLESKRGGDPFSAAIAYHDKMISRALMIPSLMLGATDRGSYALSKSHFDIFLMRIAYFQKKIAKISQKHFIRPLVDINFGKQDKYPKFAFKPMTESDKSKLADVFFKLTQVGHVNPGENWVREEFGFPEWTPGEKPQAILTPVNIKQNGGDNNNQNKHEGDENSAD